MRQNRTSSVLYCIYNCSMSNSPQGKQPREHYVLYSVQYYVALESDARRWFVRGSSPPGSRWAQRPAWPYAGSRGTAAGRRRRRAPRRTRA